MKKKSGKIRILLVVSMSLLLLSSCNGQGMEEKSRTICVAQWNVQNLFNAELDGMEYTEYTPGSGWGQSDYEKRLTNVRKVLHYLPDSSDYVVVLNEIECSDVIEDIINSADIAELGFHWYACTEEESLAIQSAVLSSIPIVGARVHQVSSGLRPVLEVELDTGREKLFVLAVHFKSNVGGVDDTRKDRLEAARVVSQVAATLQVDNPGCIVMVCGDLNEECWDDCSMGRSRYCSSPLKVSGSFEQGFWYCFWMDSALELWPSGSFYYDGYWRCYDNILVSAAAKDGTGFEFSTAGVVFKGVLKTADSKPFAWNRQLLIGVSDHVPIWAVFAEMP